MSKDTITLLGAETVGCAANVMRDAAEKMTQAVKDLDFALIHHRRSMDEWLDRLAALLEEHIPEDGKVFDVNIVSKNGDDVEPPSSRGTVPCRRCAEGETEADG